jgi:hypothetical protein
LRKEVPHPGSEVVSLLRDEQALKELDQFRICSYLVSKVFERSVAFFDFLLVLGTHHGERVILVVQVVGSMQYYVRLSNRLVTLGTRLSMIGEPEGTLIS